MTPQLQAQRPPTPPKFDALFADPRHYRADCRLLASAIRRGWLDDAPQADRNALGARFNEAMNSRWAADPKQSNYRALFAEIAAMLAMDRDYMDPLRRLLRYSWAGEVTGQATGRPRERWYVSDHPDRLDAAAIQREQVAAGVNPLDVRSVTVNLRGDDWERTDTAALVAMPDRVRRVRLWLICPTCGRRRAHLYATRAGVRCRECAGIGYGATGGD